VKTIRDVFAERVPITLGQFVKIATAMSGGEAKMMIQEGNVLVNGVVEVRRGRKLVEGDEVRIEGLESYRLVTVVRGE
jgi:ribosome-associated protein